MGDVVLQPVVKFHQGKQQQRVVRGGGGDGDDPYHKYSREVNEDSVRNSGRDKRAASSASSLQARTCTLYLQSDPMLWDYVTKPQSQGGLGYVSALLHALLVHS